MVFSDKRVFSFKILLRFDNLDFLDLFKLGVLPLWKNLGIGISILRWWSLAALIFG